MSSPVIIEVATNGTTRKAVNPAVPREPAEIVDDALACLAAGAAIVHTHTDRATACGEEGAARYAEAYRPILDERPDAILYPTFAFDREGRPEHRWHHMRLLAQDGLIRQGLLDPGSVNLGGSDDDGLPSDHTFTYVNTPADTRLAVAICAEERVGPSISIFEPGYLRVVLAAHEAGTLPPGAFVKFYFAAANPYGPGAATFGAPPIPEALDLYLAMLGDTGLPWGVACLGGPLLETPILDGVLERGGHLRVGLEDHPTAVSNVDEVTLVAQRAAAAGRPVATPTEAAALLGLPT